MNTILFYDRCKNTTDLYIMLSRELKSKVNIIHVAFSDFEEELLKKAGIIPIINYRRELAKELDNINLEQSEIDEIDQLIIEESNGRFNLNASIQSDRGYSLLTYEEALKVSVACYRVWKSVFHAHKINVMHHEPCSQYLVHIAALLCKKQGGEFHYPVQCYNDFDNFGYIMVDAENYRCPEIEDRYNFLLSHPEKVDIERAKSYIRSFREEFTVFLNGAFPRPSRFKLMKTSLKHALVAKRYRAKYDKLKDNIDFWMLNTNVAANKLYNLSQYKKKNVEFVTDIPKGERYYYYSFHLEPEATVLYLADGLYSNQVKLIENIASSIPPGTFLYVKDHPHEFAYRCADDYLRLMRIPNVRLISQHISGKQLIINSIGVFSLNGTAGFEALLMGKQVYVYAHNYYSISKRVTYIHNVKDTRSVVYSHRNVEWSDDMELYTYVCAFLESVHLGMVLYFGDKPQIDGFEEQANAKAISSVIMKLLDRHVD